MSVEKPVIIFDGECKLCNSAVAFIIARDPEAYFKFAPMQAAVARRLLEKYRIEHMADDTFVLIQNNQCLFRTDAALEIAKHLTGYWYLFQVFKIFPAGFRDFFYQLLAKNRYAIFGRREHCMVPTADVRKRFLE